MRYLIACLLLCGCTVSAQSRPTVTPAYIAAPTAQADPGVIVWPFPLTPYPAPISSQQGAPQPTALPPTLSVTHEPGGLRVTWSADGAVCPWLESGAVKLYAGGAEPCRPSGSALSGYVPDSGAQIVLRDESGGLLASVRAGFTQSLPTVAR